MSQIFEAPQHAEEERLQRNKSAEEQRSFQGRISDRTRTDLSQRTHVLADIHTLRTKRTVRFRNQWWQQAKHFPSTRE